MKQSRITCDRHNQESKNTDGHHLNWNTPLKRFLYLRCDYVVKDADPFEWKKEQNKAEEGKMTIANQHTSLWQYDLSKYRKPSASRLAVTEILN